MFHDSIIMITGGTGSFGYTILNRFLSCKIKEIRIFSRDEKKQEDLRLFFNNPKIKFYIGDVRDYNSIYDALDGVDYVFHAAALKQVPSCEFYPIEAVKTNILGTENVLNASVAHAVKKVVILSTDKAVYPINAMGLSKALAEKTMIAKARMVNKKHQTIMCATRYGNVMASRGSVIPFFIQQIKNNKPLTVTDPKMTRFLMSLENSVDLVLYAFEHGDSGDIFVQKAPAASIGDLAEAFRKIFDISKEVKFIGTRHGEKLYETLVSREEMLSAKDMESYFRIAADTRDINYNKYFTEGSLNIDNISDYNSHNTKQLSVDEIIAMLLELNCIKECLSFFRNNEYKIQNCEIEY